MSLRRFAVAAMAAIAIGVAAPAGSPASVGTGPSAVAAKTCGAGYKTAYINGAKKCLRRGQFCSPSAQKQYRRYGFYCGPNRHLQ